MTVPVTLSYRCGHEEHGRITGPDVGKLPSNYTVYVAYSCPACRTAPARAAEGNASGGQVG